VKRKQGVIGFFVHHRVAGNLVMLVMLLGGALALTRMNIQFFPTFAPDVVSVRVVWSGASAEDVERGITDPLEQRLRSVDGLKKMTSTSAQGVSSITLEFHEGTDPIQAVDDVRQQVDEFNNLPGIAVLIGGMWVANLYYWGFNQYIIQRTLAAKSLKESQKGIIFAAFLKLIIPLIVVIPGIIVYVLYTQPEGTAQVTGVVDVFTNPDGSIEYDNAYPWLMKVFLTPGFLGLVVAALAAAIVSSMASMLNSVATIFTMDIYRPYFNPNASDKQTVNMGRITAAVALITAVLMAPQLQSVPQVFQYIQEYTGMVSPGILAVFLMGLFWKKTTTKGAIYGVLGSIVIALLLKMPGLGLPFLDQMYYTLILTIVIIVGVSLTTNPHDEDPKAIHTTAAMFKTGPKFNIGAYIILILTAVLYAVFW